MKVTAIIPARLASTRLPNKPLTVIEGKTLIMHVYDRVRQIKSITRVIIATDDQSIIKVAEQAGAEAILTNINHISGTDRIAEVAAALDLEGIIINVQGDEPLVSDTVIDPLIQAFDDSQVDIASVCIKLDNAEDITNPNVVKVVKSRSNKALYFSRHTIPYNRNQAVAEYHKHIGIYAFRSDVLHAVVQLSPSMLEQSEKLEQLRWLENDFQIKMIETDHETIGIDTPEDVSTFEAYLRNHK